MAIIKNKKTKIEKIILLKIKIEKLIYLKNRDLIFLSIT